jgi:hypothetical protein
MVAVSCDFISSFEVWCSSVFTHARPPFPIGVA